MQKIIPFLLFLTLIWGDFAFIKTPSVIFLCLTTLFILSVRLCARFPFGWLAALWMLHGVHWLFGAYFGRDIAISDLYLFITHLDETFEALVGMPTLFIPPVAAMTAAGLLLLPLHRVRYPGRPCRLLLGPLFLALLWPTGGSYGTAMQKAAASDRQIPPLVRKPLMDVVLVIGESMACDEAIVKRFRKLGGYARCIVAGAVNTDVSVPLLLNGLDNPARLVEDDPHNLFALAHRNGFFTRFYSAQSRHNLRYILPYLGLGWLDDYEDTPKNERAPLYDMALLKGLGTLPRRPVFVVLHQMGQHAPYTFFAGEKDSDPARNYARSLDYSFAFYRRLIEKLDQRARPYVLIVTSDHGEFRGQKGRWGHNTFAPEVYTVPFFIHFGVDPWAWYDKVRSHGDLYRYIRYLLGYGARFVPLNPPYIVNGTMQSGEDGSIRVNAAAH